MEVHPLICLHDSMSISLRAGTCARWDCKTIVLLPLKKVNFECNLNCLQL
jgi:hypothetical protein